MNNLKMNNNLYVVKFNNKYYWVGYNKVDTQLRKAVIYKSLSQAINTAEEIIKSNRVTKEHMVTYKVVKVEIKEIGDE